LNSNHFYSRYGLALLRHKTGKQDGFTQADFLALVSEGLEHFRLAPRDSLYEVGESIPYKFLNSKEGGGQANGVFLSPHVICGDKTASKLWGELDSVLKTLGNGKFELEKLTDITQKVSPLAGEYGSRKKPKVTGYDYLLSMITTVTPAKAALTAYDGGKPKNFSIIPDLGLPEGEAFVALLVRMNDSYKSGQAMTGKKTKNGFGRPEISNGNFPQAPRSFVFSSLGLLGAIGAWARESKQLELGLEVLESLKNRPLYIVGAEKVSVESINHYIIDLAKENQLDKITNAMIKKVDIMASEKPGFRDDNLAGPFELFASRFLKLFSPPAFQDFLAFRAEYPEELEVLFQTYFINMEQEKITPELVQSCKALGAWLNRVAYFSAKEEFKTDKAKVRSGKHKILIEIESGVFSARSAHELLGNTIVRAGRISKMDDAPSEASLFMEQVASGQIGLNAAKNLLIAFSRIKATKKEEEVESADDFSAHS